jgi:hypothetical protein
VGADLRVPAADTPGVHQCAIRSEQRPPCCPLMPSCLRLGRSCPADPGSHGRRLRLSRVLRRGGGHSRHCPAIRLSRPPREGPIRLHRWRRAGEAEQSGRSPV